MQGCGKTTIVEVLEAVFKHEGLRPASISIDDFYLRFEDQQALARVGHPRAYARQYTAHVSDKEEYSKQRRQCANLSH